MASWTNATAPAGAAPLLGVLRPAATQREAALRRDYPVHPALAPYVERYWSVRWQQEPGRAPFRSEVLANPNANLTVESGDAPRHGVELPAALVFGVVTRRFVIDLAGWGRATAAKFRPGGLAALTGERVAADAVRPFPHPTLVDDVLAHDDDASRVAVLDSALAAGAPEPAADYLELAGLVERMASTRSWTRVEDVAAAAGVTVRTLQRSFRRYVGVGPKWVLARSRLQDAAAAIDTGEVDDLASLAHEHGWFDQAHFSRDFRAVVGVTPSAYLASVRRGPRTD